MSSLSFPARARSVVTGTLMSRTAADNDSGVVGEWINIYTSLDTHSRTTLTDVGLQPATIFRGQHVTGLSQVKPHIFDQHIHRGNLLWGYLKKLNPCRFVSPSPFRPDTHLRPLLPFAVFLRIAGRLGQHAVNFFLRQTPRRPHLNLLLLAGT